MVEKTRATGRPRDTRIDDALLGTTLEILDEAGYAGVSFEEVARRAGTSRPAIYRRWKGRAPLVLAAVAVRLDVPVPPDTGCTLCDIGESFNVFLASYRSISPGVLTALYADCIQDTDLRRRYVAAIVEPARNAVAHTLDHAAERGDLRADVDREMLLDMVGSLVQNRALVGNDHLTDVEAEQAIEILMKGAAVDYEALLAHSEELEHLHSHTE